MMEKISYELAKELKDAGFPKSSGLGGFLVEGAKEINPSVFEPGNIVKLNDEKIWAIPTLSELIEACGREFNGVLQDLDCKTEDVRWKACAINDLKFGNPYWKTGKTPKTAVARLWLALNKK